MENQPTAEKRKYKVLDSISHAHQFCEAIEKNKLSHHEAVEEFAPEFAGFSGDKKTAVFVFKDGSFISQFMDPVTRFTHTQSFDRGISLAQAAGDDLVPQEKAVSGVRLV